MSPAPYLSDAPRQGGSPLCRHVHVRLEGVLAPPLEPLPLARAVGVSLETPHKGRRGAAGGADEAGRGAARQFKHPGRVGDAPLVGSGLYVDARVGVLPRSPPPAPCQGGREGGIEVPSLRIRAGGQGAVATGDGEAIMRACLSFLAVEGMRRGLSPERACHARPQPPPRACAGAALPTAPPPRTKWTRRVPPPVLIGHAIFPCERSVRLRLMPKEGAIRRRLCGCERSPLPRRRSRCTRT